MITVQIQLDLGTEEFGVHRTAGYRMADNPAVIASASLNRVFEDARTWLACRAPKDQLAVLLDPPPGEAPSLPFAVEGACHAMHMEVGTGEDSTYGNPTERFPIRAVLGVESTFLTVAEAELFGLALLRAAHEIRERNQP